MNKVDSLVDTDFEGMTSVGGALFLNVEGDESSIMPTIYEYYPNPDPKKAIGYQQGRMPISVKIGSSLIFPIMAREGKEGWRG